LVVAIIDAAIGTNILGPIFVLVIIVPSIAVTWRRLHDVGRSGGWFFMSIIPLVGGIFLLVYECSDSQPGANQFGPSPKELGAGPGPYGSPHSA
ncbi:MAG: DUF805 domain-containing protein, partial [Actinomycetota bacterium]|nr:DUF805 domain-containing protein [Actinomycetota bacterium]